MRSVAIMHMRRFHFFYPIIFRFHTLRLYLQNLARAQVFRLISAHLLLLHFLYPIMLNTLPLFDLKKILAMELSFTIQWCTFLSESGWLSLFTPNFRLICRRTVSCNWYLYIPGISWNHAATYCNCKRLRIKMHF